MAETKSTPAAKTTEAVTNPSAQVTEAQKKKHVTWTGNYRYFERNVVLWPGRDYERSAKIINVDDMGFVLLITACEKDPDSVGKEVFIGHGNHLTFTFMD